MNMSLIFLIGFPPELGAVIGAATSSVNFSIDLFPRPKDIPRHLKDYAYLIYNKFGIVAILDALGVANYSDREIKRFLQSRSIVMSLLEEKSERAAKDKVTTFTFNDTVLIVLESDNSKPSSDEITAFLVIL